MVDIGIPSEAPQSLPGIKDGYGRAPVGMGKNDCKAKAQSEGAYAWDEHAQACWLVFGRAVIIQDTIHSIQEGFEVTNFNFRAGGGGMAVPGPDNLPGSVDGWNTPGIGGKQVFST